MRLASWCGLLGGLLLFGCDSDGVVVTVDSGPPFDADVEVDAGPGESDCFDGRRNGDETDRDCGGSCARCDEGRACLEGSDCRTGACIDDVCAEPSCDDGVQNQDESDADCGGSICELCDAEQRCRDDDDCESASCRGNVCQEAECDDGRFNGRETDVDCGGPDCDGCGTGGACTRRTDCLSQICGMDMTCVAPSCNDNITNGTESDRDCGGSMCRGCRDRQMCFSNADCSSDDCQAGQCNGTGDFVDDFETGAFFREWSTFTPMWTITDVNPIAGTYSARSAMISDNSSTSIEVRVSCPSGGSVSFDYDVSAASGDRLEFQIDSIVQPGGSWSGTRAGSGSFMIASGTHTLRWTYRKDFFTTSGSDSARIDNVMTTGCSSLF